MELLPNVSPPGSFPTSGTTPTTTSTDALTAFLCWKILLSGLYSPPVPPAFYAPRTGRKLDVKMWATNGGLLASPRVGTGAMCHPLTHTVAARGGRPGRVLCGWGLASPPLQDGSLE